MTHGVPVTGQRDQKVDRAVGIQLQNLRLFAHLDRQQAAHGLGLPVGVLEDIESGSVRPAAETLLAMAKLYDVLPGRIFAVASGVVGPGPRSGS